MGELFPARTPAIKLRGLHLDPCRHFISADTVVRIIEKMSALGLNALHLHLSDDQGLPLRFRRFPAIGTSPAWSVEDQERIAREARSRGIDVIPEIDIPGHCRAFLSCVDPTVTRERRLGVITHETLQFERDLPTILGLFEELVERFGARFIHLGGDEVKYARLAELVTTVCAWAAARGLQVIAWDDVLGALGAVPENLIIQRWRFRVSPKFALLPPERRILSWGYYLDHIDDPFTVYGRAPDMGGALPLGCIACSWTELITERTLECTIFPSLYMAAHRWWNWPDKDPEPTLLLRRLCDAYGYPSAERDDFRTRRWVGFYRDDPRSTTSVTIDTPLDREQDLHPAFSRSLVIVADALRRSVLDGRAPTEEERETLRRLGQQAYGVDLSFVWDRPRGWRARLKQAVARAKPSLEYNDGLAVVLRRALKSTTTQEEGDPEQLALKGLGA